MNTNNFRLLVIVLSFVLASVVVATYMNMSAQIGANEVNLTMQVNATGVAYASITLATLAVLLAFFKKPPE